MWCSPWEVGRASEAAEAHPGAEASGSAGIQKARRPELGVAGIERVEQVEIQRGAGLAQPDRRAEVQYRVLLGADAGLADRGEGAGESHQRPAGERRQEIGLDAAAAEP